MGGAVGSVGPLGKRRVSPNAHPEFEEGRKKSGGRKKGVPNKLTMLIKEAVLQAANNVGRDGKGQDGLQGYLEWVAMQKPETFCALLGRIIPTQINIEGTQRTLVAYRSRDEIARELRNRGIPIRSVFPDYDDEEVKLIQHASSK